MYSISTTAKLIGISIPTLRRWEKQGTLIPTRTLGLHRRYPSKLIENWLYEKDLNENREILTESTKSVCIYARVSTYRQNTDGNLDRQAERLEKFAKKRFGKIHPIIIKEYGSGLNPNRSGLWRLIRKIKKGEISSVIVSYPDIERYFKKTTINS
jgi:predicted site-specific integrase-resolvase